MIYTLVKNLFKILFAIEGRRKRKYSQGWSAGYSEQPFDSA